MKNDLVFIDHVIESIELIEEYLKDVSEEEFWRLFQVQDAVVRRLEIIGEAVKISPVLPGGSILPYRGKKWLE